MKIFFVCSFVHRPSRSGYPPRILKQAWLEIIPQIGISYTQCRRVQYHYISQNSHFSQISKISQAYQNSRVYKISQIIYNLKIPQIYQKTQSAISPIFTNLANIRNLQSIPNIPYFPNLQNLSISKILQTPIYLLLAMLPLIKYINVFFVNIFSFFEKQVVLKKYLYFSDSRYLYLKQGPKRHKPWPIQKFMRSHEKVMRKSRESHEKVMRKS